MQDACAFALINLPPEALKKILLKGSMRMIKYLVVAYPQAMGVSFFDALAPTLRPATLRVLLEEVSRGQLLTPAQIRGAECEFIKLVNDEKFLPRTLVVK